ncbi:MAG: prephenate dehydrogenase/arogenate dehydrogenase family protein, partial [Planctomycetes bacterium]|nr:prephenate dehydrogenase/arogenate dehydrogenase family protein [Planctomycetota bacterium]
STKQQIVAELAELDGALLGGDKRGVRFVGGHPIAGSEQSGAQHARADLFVDRPAIVTPVRSTRAEDVAALTEFWEALGARVLKMSPAQHDKIMASTSHLPHLVASVLAGTLMADELPAVSSGFADTTRIAAGDVDLWREILLGNKNNVLKSLTRFEKLLASLHKAIERGDAARITKILTDAKEKRDAVGS